MNGYLSAGAMVDVVQAPVIASEGIIDGIKTGDGGKIAGNTLLLGLSLSPLKGSGLPARLARVIPEEVAANATALGKAGDLDAFVVGAADLKGLTTSEQIAQKLSLFNKDGSLVKGPFRVIEFDTPTSGLAQPLNRTNTGFINGGKTAGGVTEYVVPNVKISELKNATQTVIK